MKRETSPVANAYEFDYQNEELAELIADVLAAQASVEGCEYLVAQRIVAVVSQAYHLDGILKRSIVPGVSPKTWAEWAKTSEGAAP